MYYEEILKTLKEVFTKYHSESVTVSCRIIECLSLCFLYLENHMLKSATDDTLFILKYFQGQIITLNDQRIFYLLSAWERILRRLRHDGLVSEVYTVLRKVMEQVFEYK